MWRYVFRAQEQVTQVWQNVSFCLVTAETLYIESTECVQVSAYENFPLLVHTLW
jgi:hypothetical protein